MIYRSKAPLRLGFAGGGTDVSPYTDRYGGAVLNATINLFAHASLEPLDEPIIVLQNVSDQHELVVPFEDKLEINGELDLLKAVYNYMQKKYGIDVSGLTITTATDTAPGCGLGTSSTMVVALIGAFMEMLNLQLTKYEVAQLAYDIERNHLGFAGGRQDQYAASFGGINYIEFTSTGETNVTHLQIPQHILEELENNLVLFYTGYSRQSGSIIKQQQQHVLNDVEDSIHAMHELKAQALLMKKALLAGSLNEVGELFDYGFTYKRKMASNISNTNLDSIYESAKKAGATGGKISGAGGGGFMFFYCPANSRFPVIETLNSFAGEIWPCSFCDHGLITWTSA